MEFRTDEITAKNKVWDNNLNLWHDCKKSPEAKRKKENEEFAINQRKFKVARLKTPVYCIECNHAVKLYEPCNHMIRDGFRIGIDGSDFYSDSYVSVSRREQLKNSQKKISLDSFK